MPPYTLLEHKLRRYIYLGHDKNIYVPHSFRKNFWHEEKHHDDIICVRLIGKVVRSRDRSQINSIVPILLKVNSEDLFEDDNLIYALAVCTRFNDKYCKNMIDDAYKAVKLICKDGMQILKFVHMAKVANRVLYKLGYISKKHMGYGEGFRNVIRRWYLNNDPYEVTKEIVTHKQYYKVNHRQLMRICRLESPDPCRKIFIIYTFRGLKVVKKIFSQWLIETENDDIRQQHTKLQFMFIYNYLEKMDYGYNSIPIEQMFAMIWEKDIRSIPQSPCDSYHALRFFVTHSPLKTLLNKTYCLAKKNFFYNVLSDEGCSVFIARFNENQSLKNSGIHPMESYLEYIKYRSTGFYESEINDKKKKIIKRSFENTLYNIEDWHSSSDSIENQSNNILNHKKKRTQQLNIASKSSNFSIGYWHPRDSIEAPKINLTYKDNQSQEFNVSLKSSTDTENSIIDNTEEVPVVVKTQKKQYCKTKSKNFPPKKTKWKPKPVKAELLLKFLSVDLVGKTLQNLKSYDCQILIAYDSRPSTYKKFCKYMHLRFLRVCDAIIIITLSIIYPNSSQTNSPFICALKDSGSPFKIIKVNNNTTLTVESLEKDLYSVDKLSQNTNRKTISPLATINWAKRSNKNIDVFVFLGTSTMNMLNILRTKKLYEESLKKKVKIIICCLTGGSVGQTTFCNRGILFIVGIDKNVCKIIDAFINEKF